MVAEDAGGCPVVWNAEIDEVKAFQPDGAIGSCISPTRWKPSWWTSLTRCQQESRS